MVNKQGIRDVLSLDVDSSAPTFIIYSEQVSARLNYVCRFVFAHVLKVKFIVTSSSEEFEASRFYKINYSPEIIDRCLRVIPAGLLRETGVTAATPQVTTKNGKVHFYSQKDGDLKFDIFSAVFYMISRYEEWQGFEPDKHGRFEINQSILFKYDVAEVPVVDVWIMELRKCIAEFFPGILLPVLHAKTISTIDVDNLSAYRDKSVLRTAGAFAKDLLKGDFRNCTRRLKVLNGKEKDPFQIYETVTKFCKSVNVPVIYFFLFRSGTPYDRTVDPRNPAFKKAIEQVRENGGYVGIHPSYYTSEEPDRLSNEVKALSQVAGMHVLLSRQHYLRFHIKTTPKALIKNGILADFTMGFASAPGFRAGTSRPFYYYDFDNESETELLFVPFCVMDGAYTVYDKKSPEEALRSLSKIRKEIEAVYGLFITVFHERTFAEHLYPGYGDLYKSILK